MSWTESLDLAELASGPFLVAKGAAGSELSIGEIINLELSIEETMNDIACGTFFGTATIRDQVVNGVNVSATFGMFQNIGNNAKDTLNLVFPQGRLSTGPTKKTLSLRVWSSTGTFMVGKLASDNTDRWVFHKYSVSDLTDNSNDIVLPKARLFVGSDAIPLNDEGSVVFPCMLRAYPDSNGDVLIIGKDAA